MTCDGAEFRERADKARGLADSGGGRRGIRAVIGATVASTGTVRVTTAKASDLPDGEGMSFFFRRPDGEDVQSLRTPRSVRIVL